MKVLLVNPPIPKFWYNNEYYLPSSMLYLASSLRQHGHIPKILDMKIYTQEESPDYEVILCTTIQAYKPDLIAFGCLFSGNFPDVLHFATTCKKQFSHIPIVAGGIHFTIHAERIMEQCPVFDLIVFGEGERSLPQIAAALTTGSGLTSIDGLAWRESGAVRINQKTSYIENPDEIPFPAYDLVNLQDYFVDTSAWHNPKGLPINTSIPIITSRSCPLRCNFCSMYTVMGPRWRPRSSENVVQEIELLYHTYHHRHFSIMDDNFTLNKPRVLEICRLIRERGLNIQFDTANGLNINSLDEEIMDALVEAGMVRVALAIESGSDYIRNTIMGKHLSRDKILDVVALTRRYPHLHISAFFIIGLPEETRETLEETYEMIKLIEADKIQLMNIVPFPHTAVFDQAVRDGLLVELDTETLFLSSNLYFKNSGRFFIKPYQLELEELEAFRQRCIPLIAERQRTVRHA